MSKLLVGSATDVGLVRSNNQDQLLVAPGLYAVADGMGGHAAGEVASETAVRALRAAFEASDVRSAEALRSAAKAANRAVWEQARANRGMFGMGTTLVALAVVERQDGTNALAVAHIGDSRLYLLRGQSFHQVTVDHSLVQELVDDGQITEAEAAVHPQRHVLTRALGVEPSAEVDLIHLVPEPGDRYLLCSDGLPREASDDQIAAVLTRFADPTEAARELVALANSNGGNDNISVVVVDVSANDASPKSLIVVPPGEDPERYGHDRGRAPSATAATGSLSAGQKSSITGSRTPGDRKVRSALRQPPTRQEHGATALPGRLTWRVVSFVSALCIVVGGAIGCLAWYARSSYFVTLSGNRISIYQGRPGGVMWFQPTLAERTDDTASSVLPYNLGTLRAGHLEPSLPDAKLYISRLISEKREAEVVTPASARGAPRSASKTTTTARTTTARTARAVPTTRPVGTPGRAGRAKPSAPA